MIELEMYLTEENDLEWHRIVCKVCDKVIAPYHGNHNIFWGSRCMDTGMFVCFACKKQYYLNKHAGLYGNEHRHKYSEMPVPVPRKKPYKPPLLYQPEPPINPNQPLQYQLF